MFQEHLSNLPTSLTSFTPYGTITHREGWESLAPSLREALLSEGEHYIGYSFPSLTATLFLEFTRTGNRTHYEEIYWQRRNALNALILAECVEHQGRFLDDITNGLWTTLEESAWQLPAHNSWMRSMPNAPLPDVTKPVLELFSCETGALLAMAYYLLKEVLDPITPLITCRIEQELNHRILTPYLNQSFWWMGNGEESLCNWTIWCTQNILLTTFLLPTGDEVRQKVLAKALRSIDYFLLGYGEDGCCDEGAQYYHHAGLCLFNTLEILNGLSGDAFIGLYNTPKIKNIARYISTVHVGGPYYLNFADCSPKAGLAGAREFLFGKRTQQPELMDLAAAHYGLPETVDPSHRINLFYRVQALFTDQEMRLYKATSSTLPQECYYESVGVFIARDPLYVLGVKAGNNGDSHNHNDTGSLTLYKEGHPLLIDVGVESYTAKTFSSQRYDIWTMQSAYHNVATLNGKMQLDGASYQAREVQHFFSPTKSQIEMELIAAYPNDTGLSSYHRKVTLLKGEGIEVEDTFTYSSAHQVPIVIHFMTYEKPSLVNAHTLSIGHLGTLSFLDSAPLVTIEAIPITDPRLQTAWEHEIYRISLTLTHPTIHFMIQ